MNLLSDAKKLVEHLEKVKENLSLNKSTTGSIFSALELRKGSFLGSETTDLKQIVTKSKKYHFRITFMKDAIQFLDIKSILNLCLVNKEFNYFVKSIYFYKFMTDARNSKLKHKANTRLGNKAKVANNAGLFGNFVGALGSVFGLGSGKKETKFEKKVDSKLFEEKLNIHEKILKSKLKNLKLSSEIKAKREEIDSIIINRKLKKNESTNKLNASLYQNFQYILKDEEIEQIKRDKLEKEYNDLVKEVEQMRAETEELNAEVGDLQKSEIETEKILTSMNTYLKNNMKVEDVKITPKENFKSSKYGEVDNDISTIALLNYYIDK